MVKSAGKGKAGKAPRRSGGAISKPPRLKAAADIARSTTQQEGSLRMDTGDEIPQQANKKGRTKHSKVKRSLVRKKRRVRMMGAKHKQSRKGIN
ncbi:MAG: hypothetical protein SGPRY_004571 [Prymnesium sp.]